MRLYDQKSSTPMSSTDAKKWQRPTNFIPNPSKTTEILQDRFKEQRHVDPKPKFEDHPIENPVKECKLTETNFLFDIDEEISMKSSSTLSSSSTFRHDTEMSKPLGPPKSFPTFDSLEEKDKTVKEENPFRVLHSADNFPIKKIQQATAAGRSIKQKKDSLKLSKQGFIDEAFSTPELTLTESSDGSGWLDFSSEFDTSDTFKIKREDHASNEAKYQGLCLYPVPNKMQTKTPSFEPNSISIARQKKTPDSVFMKYSSMLIRGHSVAEVSKVMAADQIDPCVISLVMLAATEAHSSM
jgi:hypothetical protein